MSSRSPSRSSHSPTRPRAVSLAWEPEEVAARLAHLPGFCWLDSAGNDPLGTEGLSIFTALPEATLVGHLSDQTPLETALAGLAAENSSRWDWGFPVSGLFGAVSYEGDYHFQVCRNLLIYHHASGEWWESGELSRHFQTPKTVCRKAQLDFQPGWTRENFLAAAQRAQEYIAAGDIYQVNLAHRFTAPWPENGDTLAFYHQLRAASPAPYAACMNLGDREIFCSSPESFLQMSGNTIRTRPIKGTRPRFADAVADQKSALDLLTSEKERAELLMITDLLRNDLGQICQFGTVQVPELLRLETYAQVFHLVSTVQGTLRPEVSQVQALQACFPGGSITGAPKKRAREIISELEPTPRGLYTGALGYLGSNGESQFNIAIRTVVKTGREAEFHVGAGIVADSVPELEWEETWHKARGILAAAGG